MFFYLYQVVNNLRSKEMLWMQKKLQKTLEAFYIWAFLCYTLEDAARYKGFLLATAECFGFELPLKVLSSKY